MTSKLYLYLITGDSSRKLTEQLSAVVGVNSVRQYSDFTGTYNHLLELGLDSNVSPSAINDVLQAHKLSGHVSMPLAAGNDAVAVISVLGMTCDSCTKLIESRVSNIDGVNCIAVSLQHNEAFVEYNSQLTNIEQITTVMCDAGFDALPLTAFTYHHNVTNSSVKIVTMGVQGMVCMNCVNIIENNISKKSGVTLVTASLEQNNATIEYDSAVVDEHQLKDAIEDLGFEVTLFNQAGTAIDNDDDIVMDGLNSISTVSIGITGMKCQSCVQMIENGVMDVIDINVSLEKKEATVTFDSRHCSIEGIRNCICSLGFDVTFIRREFCLLVSYFAVNVIQ